MELASQQPKEHLWNKNFVRICIGNFMLFFSFYLIMPLLPLYLHDTFPSQKGIDDMLFHILHLFCRIFPCLDSAALCHNPHFARVLVRLDHGSQQHSRHRRALPEPTCRRYWILWPQQQPCNGYWANSCGVPI